MEPAWDVARLFPNQGCWTEADYFALPDRGLVEFTLGHIEVLPMPTELHQLIVRWLFRAIDAHVAPRDLGEVIFAPLRLRIGEGRFREPDLLFLRRENDHLRGDRFWSGADWVIEVISPDAAARDRVQKREEYALAAIGEYWIVDPLARSIEPLVLAGAAYKSVAPVRSGMLPSMTVPGCRIDVERLFRDVTTAQVR